METERCRENVFTIVELLVVIAIIAILASLLLPALKNAKDMGYKAGCTSNMKQFSLAHQFYSNDYNEYVAVMDHVRSGAVGTLYWVLALNTYLGLPDTAQGGGVFDCPATQRTATPMREYTLNRGLGTWIPTGGSTREEASRMVEFKKPSDTVLNFDSGQAMSSTGTGDITLPVTHYGTYWNTRYTETHLRKANILFVDGHVDSASYIESLAKFRWVK